MVFSQTLKSCKQKNPAKINNVDKESAKQLNFKGVKLPVHKKDSAKLGKQISVFSCEDQTPYCIYSSKQTFEKHVDLLLLLNYKNSHYV